MCQSVCWISHRVKESRCNGADNGLTQLLDWFQREGAAGVVATPMLLVARPRLSSVFLRGCAALSLCYVLLFVPAERALHDAAPSYGLDDLTITTCGVAARRALAARTDAFPADWRRLGKCMVESRAARPVVMFVHVSKSGGTSVCQDARSDGCSTDGNNCWVIELDDGPSWISPEAVSRPFLFTDVPSMRKSWDVASCADRLQFSVNRGLNFVAVENYLSAEMVGERACEREFVSLIYLRETLTRLHSHFRNTVKLWPHDAPIGDIAVAVRPWYPYLRFTAEDISKSALKEGRPPFPTPPHLSWWVGEGAFTNSTVTPASFDVPRLARLLPIISDNYVVRTLAGDAAFHLPYGGINRSHYDVALETLRNLDWVVPLESTHKKVVLTAGLGWQGDEPSVFSDLGALEGAAAEASSELWKSIQDSIAESSLAIQEAVDSSPEAMEAAEAVKDAAETVKDAAEAVKDAATDSLDVVQDAAASSIESVLESTKAIQDAAIESLDSEAAETVKDAAEAVQDAATDSLDVVQEAAASSLDAVLESTKAIEHAAIESLDGAIESLDSVVKGEGGAQEAVFMSDAITGRGARRRTQNIFSPSSQNDGKVNIDQHASWYAPFTDSDKELLTKLNRFDIALRAEADRLHALDLVSLEQLARHYPAAVLPSKPSQPATSCCGYTCVNTDKQVNDGRGPQAAVRVLVTWVAVVAAAAAAACAALLTRRGAMERGAHVLT